MPKLVWETLRICELVDAYNDGVPLKDLAKKYKVKKNTIEQKISDLRSQGFPIPKRERVIPTPAQDAVKKAKALLKK